MREGVARFKRTEGVSPHVEATFRSAEAPLV